jgi:alkaline phosphatase
MTGFLLLGMVVTANARDRAKNVILFLGDGTGPSTLNAASIYGYGKARALYIQNMPHIALSETSSASSWVTDSAAGMTAIVTGQKTHNGVISQSASAERGIRDGEPLKTILEYAEERGLSTGVVSNSSVADATPAACYAHANDRKKHGEIFAQVLHPRFGDGVDVIIGPGRQSILEKTSALGVNLETELPRKGFVFLATLEAVSQLEGKASRLVALMNSEEFDLGVAVEQALRVLSRNPRGFFLMVESNNHFRDARKTLERTVTFDRVIRQVAERQKRNTLILCTADHSYDLRMPKGNRQADILSLVNVVDAHTAEEVLVSADGPGSKRVRGIFPNTHLFEIMMSAYGWKAPSEKRE